MRYINQEYITNTLEEKIMMTLNNDLAFINAVLCFQYESFFLVNDLILLTKITFF